MIYLFIIGYLLIFGLSELAAWWAGWSRELGRKSYHVLSAIWTAAMPWYLERQEILIISLLFFFLLALARRFHLLSQLRAERRTIGELAFPLGVGLAAFFLLPEHIEAFQFGILVMGFADGAAGYFGQRYARRHLSFVPGKSYVGWLAFLVGGLMAILLHTLYYQGLQFDRYIFVIIMASLLELALRFGLDNLFLPVFAGMLFVILM